MTATAAKSTSLIKNLILSIRPSHYYINANKVLPLTAIVAEPEVDYPAANL